MSRVVFLTCLSLLLIASTVSAAEAPAAPKAGAEASTPAESQVALEFGAYLQAQEKNHCSVSYTQCSSGTISCTGHSYCTSGTGWVECDGQRTYCPSSGCTASCQNNPSFGECFSASGNCDSGWSYENNEFYYSCDGNYYSCPHCPNGQIIC